MDLLCKGKRQLSGFAFECSINRRHCIEMTDKIVPQKQLLEIDLASEYITHSTNHMPSLVST